MRNEIISIFLISLIIIASLSYDLVKKETNKPIQQISFLNYTIPEGTKDVYVDGVPMEVLRLSRQINDDVFVLNGEFLVLASGIHSQLFDGFTKNYPKEMAVCANFENNTLASISPATILSQKTNSVISFCAKNQILIHSHPDLDFCRPSITDIRNLGKNELGGIVCGREKPEAIVFYGWF